jgi:hypothetical protein
MELKVACDCGQKYKFDVEPVEGRMPFTVNCPVCGIDGTPAANELLAKNFSSSPVVPVAPIEPAPLAAGGLRINRSAPVAAPPPPLFANSAAPPPLPTSAPAPVSRPGIPIRNLVSPPVKAGPTNNLWLGILGAFLGAAIGGGLVFGFYLWTGFRMPLMGTCIGLIAGIGARLLARGGDATLGAIAATLSVFSSVCALYFSFHGYLSIGMIISIIVSGVIAFKSSSY